MTLRWLIFHRKLQDIPRVKKKLDGNAQRDQLKLSQLSELGWRVLTTWECEIKNKGDADVDSHINMLADKIMSV